MKQIEEPAIWKVEIHAETVDREDYPGSVAAVTLLDCWIGVAWYSTFRQRYEPVFKRKDEMAHYAARTLMIVSSSECIVLHSV